MFWTDHASTSQNFSESLNTQGRRISRQKRSESQEHKRLRAKCLRVTFSIELLHNQISPSTRVRSMQIEENSASRRHERRNSYFFNHVAHPHRGVILVFIFHCNRQCSDSQMFFRLLSVFVCAPGCFGDVSGNCECYGGVRKSDFNVNENLKCHFFPQNAKKIKNNSKLELWSSYLDISVSNRVKKKPTGVQCAWKGASSCICTMKSSVNGKRMSKADAVKVNSDKMQKK